VKVSVQHIPQAKTVEFKVMDTGIGIAEDELPHIFDVFRQANADQRTSTNSVGLGLYIVKKFTELLGGNLEVDSKPGKGSTFTVSIPCERQNPSLN
jgi:signal transduction histidine kinase